MKAVIYARYSSENQTEASIEGQIRECMEYATYNDIQVIGNYIDRALSAKTDHRPEFQRMIKDSYKRAFDCIIVWKLDRFSRNRYDSAHYKALLRKNGVKVISAKETIAEGSEGILLESVLEGMAEYYSAELAEKVTRGMKENALKGLWNGGNVPFGYVINNERKLDIDPQAAPVVQEIFKLSNDGKTVKEIYRIMNERKVTRSNGKALRYNAIRYMLSNRVYIGEYHHMGVVIENSVPQLVSKELFNAVQLELAKNSKAPARHTADQDYLLTTKMICGYCGMPVVAESNTGKKREPDRFYYKCKGRKRKLNDCRKASVRKEKLEQIVLDTIMNRLTDKGFMDKFVQDVLAEQEKRSRERSSLQTLLKEQRQNETTLNNILSAIEKGVVNNTTQKRMKELEERQEELERLILIERSKQSAYYSESQIREYYEQVLQAEPQTLINFLIKQIILYDDKIEIYFNTPTTGPDNVRGFLFCRLFL